MSLRSLVRRRPSAALVVSFLALFVALGGAGYAALRIPAGSVGTAQLQNFSVGNAKLKFNSVGPRKIIAGSVGAAQVNSSQVQLRVTGPCSTGAIQSIAQAGNPTCTPTLPNEYGVTAPGANLGPSVGQVASLTLPGSQSGSPYLVMATVHALAASSGQHTVEVDCSLSPPGSAGTKGSISIDLGNPYSSVQEGTISLVLPAVISSPSQTVALSCSDDAAQTDTVQVNPTINAIQTASNN